MKRAFYLLFALSLTACLNVEQPSDTPSDPTTETFDPSLQVDLATMTKTSGGAYYKDLVIGSGTATLTGQPNVLFTYIGFVTNGATFGSGSQTTPLPLSQLVEGLQEGMQGMKVGGQRLIVMGSALGYGPTVAGPIPPNSTLIFRIQLDGLP